MINYLPPTFYPDELFFSVGARYNDHMRYPHGVGAVEDIFGAKIRMTSIVLPNRLGHFIESLSPNIAQDTDQILSEHTFLPLYRPFLDAKDFDDLRGKMLNSNRTPLGFFTRSVSQTGVIAYCTQCLCEDRETYGEAYWHRTHQALGIDVCHKHGTHLSYFEIPRDGYVAQFYSAEKHAVDSPSNDLRKTRTEVELLKQKLAQEVFWLLNHAPAHIDADRIYQLQRIALIRSGFFRLHGSKIQAATKKMLAELEISHHMELQTAISPPDLALLNTTWLSRFFGKSYVGRNSPLQHLGLMQFLGSPLSSLVDEVEDNPDQITEVLSAEIAQVKPAAHKENVIVPTKQAYHRREQFLKVVSTNPQITRTELQKQHSGLYKWLMHNDKAWLKANMPEPVPSVGGYSTVDWDQRDSVALEKIKESYDSLMQMEGKPKRVSASRLVKTASLDFELTNNFERLPKTKALIDSLIESAEDVTIRRIRWAVSYYNDKGAMPKTREFKEMAGVYSFKEQNGTITSKVQQALDDALLSFPS